MQTYILALSKYFITGMLAAYTLLSFFSLTAKRRGTGLPVRAGLTALLFLTHAAGMLTVYTAYQEPKYLFFWLFQAIIFSSAILLFRVLYPEGNFVLYNNMCMMLMLGLVLMTRLSFSRAVRQFFIAAVGLSLALAVPALLKRFRFLGKLTYVYAASGAAALLVVLLLGRVTQGSRLSYSVLGVSLQPSEFVKILFVFYLASAYYEAAGLREVLAAGAVAAVHVLALVASRDLGTAVIFFVAFFAMTFLASGKWRYLVAGLILGAAGSVLGYRLFAHVRVRVQAFLDPWSVIDSMGYQITQALFSISNGGPFGTGLTQGIPDKIPYVESDFIFAAAAEELGLIAAMLILALCLLIFVSILRIALNFADRFYRFISFGFAVIYIFQTFLTIGGETRFIPLTGVTLPLVSYGGSSVLSTIFMFSVVEAVFVMQQDRMQDFERRFRQEQAQEEASRARPEFLHGMPLHEREERNRE